MTGTKKGMLIGAIGTLLLLAATGLIVVLTGSYNVAASNKHNPVVGWALHTTMENSVRDHAEDLGPAPKFTSAMIERGGVEYKAMCVRCHGGIGEKRSEWANAMLPQPPALAHAAQEWSPQEVFWMVKHGIKMSAMPAFGTTHDDPTIWSIVAFVNQMPQMNEAQYAAIKAEHGEEGHEHDARAEAGHH